MSLLNLDSETASGDEKPERNSQHPFFVPVLRKKSRG